MGERIFGVFDNLLIFFIMIIMAYPIWHILMASFSDSSELIKNTGVLLLPRGFSTKAYQLMAKNPNILTGYMNTLFIVLTSVTLNIIFTSVGAYFLSRKRVMWQKPIMVLIIFSMYFSGGLIPSYLLIAKTLHLNNSYWAIILPSLVSTYNLVVMRTSFASIPDSLEEAARIDGAGHITILVKIILPLSMPIISVMILYYGVAHWNAWFPASIYLKDRSKYPLQLILREILIANNTSSMANAGAADIGDALSVSESVKYAVIVTATFPILCVYPFLQKYFVKGVMIGAVKG
ncbi:MAG: carbohydrate ABC transporter permease [Clostridia bacterium]|nr:carbohydrate ABC transporter permease [Clostridia bacterium]